MTAARVGDHTQVCFTLRACFILFILFVPFRHMSTSMQTRVQTLILFTGYTDTIQILSVQQNWETVNYHRKSGGAQYFEQAKASTEIGTLVPVTRGTKSLVISLEMIGLRLMCHFESTLSLLPSVGFWCPRSMGIFLMSRSTGS